MALIESMEKGEKARHGVHGPVRCAYCVFVGPDGKPYLQLDTYGSRSRKLPDKTSQSIQITEQSAGVLVRLIRETFPGLAT